MDNIEKHFPLVWSIARSFSREQSEDSDAYAEGLLHLFHAAKTYDPERGNFATWARTLVLNGLRQWRKKRGNARLLGSDVDQETEQIERGSYPIEQARQLAVVASEITGKDGEILRARLNGETFDVISQRLGVSRQAVEQRFNRRVMPQLRSAFGVS